MDNRVFIAGYEDGVYGREAYPHDEFTKMRDAYSRGLISADSILNHTGTSSSLREAFEKHLLNSWASERQKRSRLLQDAFLLNGSFKVEKNLEEEIMQEFKFNTDKQTIARYSRDPNKYDPIVIYANMLKPAEPKFQVGDIVSVIPGYEQYFKIRYSGEVIDYCLLFNEFTVAKDSGSTVVLDAYGRFLSVSSHHIKLVKSVNKLSDKYPQEYEDMNGIIVKDSDSRSNIIMEIKNNG